MRFLFLILIPVYLLHSQEPQINSVSDSILIHGNSFAITGTNFGTKDPAAPLIWDDCEGATTNSQATVRGSSGTFSTQRSDGNYGWDQTRPDGSYAPAHMMYRVGGFRSVPAAHANGTQYASGCHWMFPNNNPAYIGAGEGYRDVGLTVDSGVADKDFWFAMWYYRVDPEWADYGCQTGMIENHKFCVKQEGQTMYDLNNAYDSFRTPPACANGDFVQVTIGHHSSPCNRLYTTSPYGPYLSNPMDDWVKVEHRHASNNVYGRRDFYFNNVHAAGYDGECPNWLDNTRSFTVGGYARWSVSGNPGSAMYGDTTWWRYFDDVYIDHTWSRVILGNAPTYTTCTILEPQIPSAWSNTSITCTVNLGRLTGNSGFYLYVFNADDDWNMNGFLIGEEPPSKPTGMDVGP